MYFILDQLLVFIIVSIAIFYLIKNYKKKESQCSYCSSSCDTSQNYSLKNKKIIAIINKN